MYKFEIALKNGCPITTTSEAKGMFTMFNELENKDSFIQIGDVIVRKDDILYVREVKDDE
jgi:hypothetical protein